MPKKETIDPENPPLTSKDIARMRPLSEADPALYKALMEFQTARKEGRTESVQNSDGMVVMRVKSGRPKLPEAKRKRNKTFKLSPDVIDRIESSGRGYNARVDAVLRAAVKDGRI